MLIPYNPCICKDTPCEQCMFGYQSEINAHNLMKNLILRVENGEKPVGWTLVKNHKSYHPNWKEEMKGEPSND